MAAPTVRDSARSQGVDAESARCFLVLLGPELSETRELPASGTLSIGRDEDADVRIVDALASRNHARLYLGATVEVEDLGSANGTRVKDQRIPAHQRIPVAPGEAIAIGTTVLLVQRKEPAFRPRRLWPHGYFETRLIEVCAQAQTSCSTFAVLRLRVGPTSEQARCEEQLMKTLRPGDVLAGYGPQDYEILLVDTDNDSAEALRAEMLEALKRRGIEARSGIAHFPGDGISPQVLMSKVADRLHDGGTLSGGNGSVVLENAAMRDLYRLAEKVARGTINVLILGETGAGKEILAETVHRMSPRAAGPLVSLNCAALSDTLLESELFGYEKGAFTGALQPKAGLLEAASGGTLFLDEIGEMSLPLQAKVLRAIETRQVLRVGATKARPVDVRFVAATNRDLEEEVAAKRFREDLYFRLNGVSLTIPPLRERLDELPALAKLFLEKVAAQTGFPLPAISREAMAELGAYAWPGNLRELRNVMERALLLSSGGTILPDHLPLEKLRRGISRVAGAAVPSMPPPAEPGQAPPSSGGSLNLVDMEKQAMLEALARCAGNQTRAAELLGMPRRTFCKRMSEYNIARPRA